MRVLVVEDNEIDLKLVGAVLHLSGYSVEEQLTARGAMRALETRTPDVILLDMRLPDLAGLALVKAIRAALEPRAVPIIALTSYPEPYPREDVLAAGCANYIVKPIDTRALAQMIREATAGRS